MLLLGHLQVQRWVDISISSFVAVLTHLRMVWAQRSFYDLVVELWFCLWICTSLARAISLKGHLMASLSLGGPCFDSTRLLDGGWGVRLLKQSFVSICTHEVRLGCRADLFAWKLLALADGRRFKHVVGGVAWLDTLLALLMTLLRSSGRLHQYLLGRGGVTLCDTCTFLVAKARDWADRNSR